MQFWLSWKTAAQNGQEYLRDDHDLQRVAARPQDSLRGRWHHSSYGQQEQAHSSLPESAGLKEASLPNGEAFRGALIYRWSFSLPISQTNLILMTRHCCNSQYIVWVKIIAFSFMPKIIRILRSCSMKIFSKFPTVNISKLNFWLVICIAKNLIWTTLKMIFSIFWFFLLPQIPDFLIVVSQTNIFVS